MELVFWVFVLVVFVVGSLLVIGYLDRKNDADFDPWDDDIGGVG